MKKIDRETVQKILDAADIVEVVSDFVSLKRRGANYIGLCPFHNERTPSFSVSKAKGICKCFSCGKGGSPVNFLMELEQLSFNEALRWLARKYHIEIKEHEMTDAERDAANEREAMLAINDFACKHFEHNLWETDEGRNIGYSYFRERGISDESMRRFRLGYAIDRPDELSKAAFDSGFSEKYLVTTGLCSKSERGLYDRFKSRVIYPVFSVSGRIVAFGGRTLRKDKNVAKYVNSPESALYRKSFELYGLYQAKKSIVKQDKCILVEGYMDVISMSQIGVENVVASSGTSLTEGQIRLIHRFTNNVTVIYDSDAAGIKASLRGIDLLLAEGLDIKVLLLPDGDDPDSFAQSHTLTEVEQYMAEHETDFIRFKTDILLKDAQNDPIRRAHVITDIVGSIARIPDQIKRTVYIQECSRMLDMDEKVLSQQLAKAMAANAEKVESDRMRQQARQSLRDEGITPPEDMPPVDEPPLDPHGDSRPGEVTAAVQTQLATAEQAADMAFARYIERYEREIVRYVVRYGMLRLCEQYLEDGSVVPMNVFQFVTSQLKAEGLSIANPVYVTIMDRIASLVPAFEAEMEHEKLTIDQAISRLRAEGYDEIRRQGTDLSDMHKRESLLDERLTARRAEMEHEFAVSYLVRILVNEPDDNVRRTCTELASDNYHLSAIHTRHAHIVTEEERLPELVPTAFYAFENAILSWQFRELTAALGIAQKQGDIKAQQEIMKQLVEKKKLEAGFARFLGDRVVTPRK